ncbi:tyrosine-type recombinase/integrase [Campylobacter ureolyticus]|uniref:tyrosine-type recombinase/integrase n=1 Tax=Campylobacter ureolyticus TaxID=827 RepID=UPI0022B5E205|nr:site-specific integrase [Campylobacter ureolyticus]MCZ6157812.1 tyrosine-type recombinase/integrase [Campylobacter ureolyticus]MCZ6175068.1 tyrosine-type recombinase/integrase [Campylobacter ureolyticus]
MKFSYYSDLYLKLGKDYWKNSTFEKNKGIVKNRLSFFKDMSIKDIKPSLIKLWLNNIDDVSNKSKKHYLNSLSLIFQLALEDEEINKNPIIFIKKLHHKTPRIEPFSNDEVIKILRYSTKFNDKYQLFLKIGFYTGMRTGEILSLKFNEVDLKNKVIHINSTRSRFGENSPKTIYSIRIIPIINLLYDSLKSYMQNYQNNIYLLQTQYNEPYRDTQVFTKRFWKPTLKALNIDYRRLYNMRHTYATNMLYQNIVTPVELAKLLGHSNPKMIYDVYVNYLNSNLKDFNREIQIY